MTTQPAPAEGRRSGARPHLVVARVGDASLHPTWTQGERTFDLAVDYYGSTPGRWSGTSEHYYESKGSKWRGLHRLLTANPQLLTGYDAVWFPDDDIATDADTISAMFALHAELGLGLSQPSLTPDSYFTHLMTLSHPGLALRVTNFVEVMVPVFSRAALEACLPTFDESESGYGLDIVWQAILPGMGLRSAILDCVSVKHTRPLGSGSLYDGMQEPPHREGARVARQHGMPTPHAFATLEALDVEGVRVPAEELQATVLRCLPRPTVQQVPAWDLYEGELRGRVQSATCASPRAIAPEVVRPVAEGEQPSGAVDLSGLDLDQPLVLVVAQDGLDRVIAWRAAGWQTVLLPPGHPGHLGEHLAEAERFTVRAVDVEELDGGALERTAQLARSAGCSVVVRTAPEALHCRHDVAEHVRRALGGCQPCSVQWRAVLAASTRVVAHDAASAQWLEPLAAHAGQVVRQLEIRTPGAAPETAGGPAPDRVGVVVFDRGRPGDLDVLLRALADQRGVAVPVEVVVVPSAARIPAPRTTDRAGAVTVRTVQRSGPAGFLEAVTSAAAARVLVLDSSDVPGPWCLRAHSDAAAGAGSATAVVSRARATLRGPDDPFTDALHGIEHVPGPGSRVSVPTARAAALAGTQAVASAATATAVLAAGQQVSRPSAPTHSALPFADLAADRRSVVLAALAAGTASAPDPEDVQRLAPDLTHWSHQGVALAGLAQNLLPVPGAVLRQAVVNPVRGDRGVDAVRDVLEGELAAHWAAATAAVAAVRAAAERGERFTLAVSAGDERLVPLLTQLATSAVVEKDALRIRICLAPSHADGRSFAAAFAADLSAAGARFEDLPDVDVVTGAADRCLEADVVLGRGEPWFPGCPVPLLALDPLSWLAYLGVAARAARRAHCTPRDRRSASC